MALCARSITSDCKFLLPLLAALAASPGCDAGSKVVFPAPRTVADDDDQSPPAAAQAASPAPKKTIVTAPQQASKQDDQPKPATRAEATLAAVQQANTGGPAPTLDSRPRRTASAQDEAPTRPVDLSAWTHDDFRAAKANRDARLVQAVQQLGRSTSDVETNARLLVELLRNDDPDATAVSPAEGASVLASARVIPGLAQAIVAALGENHSDPARNALKEILLGRLRSNVEDRTLTVAALNVLAGSPGVEAESLLFTILTMPDAIRPPRLTSASSVEPSSSQAAGGGVFTGIELQKECAALVRKSASPQLRWQLAEYLAQPATPAAHRTLLLPMLVEQRSENLRAQTVLAMAEVIEAPQRLGLQRHLVAQARRSIDNFIGACDTQYLRATTDAAVRSALMSLEPAQLQQSYQTAEVLWSQASIDKLAARLEELQNPQEDGELMALATSLPADALRPIVRKHLFEHWTDGDALTKTPQFTATAIRDPGMLLVLKSLPREDAQARALPSRGGAKNPQQQRLAKERQAKLAWMSAVQTLVGTLNRRCEIAGRVARLSAARKSTTSSTQPVESVEDLNRLIEKRRQASTNATPPDAPSDAMQLLPLEIPAGAEVEVDCQLRWPEQLEGRLSAPVSPLVIHYARLRLEEQGPRVVAFFKRQMKGALEHTIENGRWLDSAERLAPGKLRSIDVMITRSKPASTILTVTRRNEREDLVVELLWLEINDFMGKPE